MEAVSTRNIKGLLRLAKSKGYKVFERPYELNIWGIRTDSVIPNKFDDKMLVFWKDDLGNWKGKKYNITTDPGTYWLNNPMNPQGTAILKEGQFLNSHELGLHQGKYEALVQRGNLTVLRDYDRNSTLDFKSGREETGSGFGINIHRANSTGTTKTIDKNSAGCQVFENADSFGEFLTLARKHKSLYGNKFSYTLEDQRAYNRKQKRIGLYVGIGILAVAAVYVGYRMYKNKPVLTKNFSYAA